MSGDDPEIATKLRIEERELEAGGLNLMPESSPLPPLDAVSYRLGNRWNAIVRARLAGRFGLVLVASGHPGSP